MPRIVLKPKSPEFADHTIKSEVHICDMPNCGLKGEHKAPKHRGLNEYYNFCLEHVQEYNRAWNFFSGMSDREVQDHMEQSLYGDRPTWRYDLHKAAEEALHRRAADMRGYDDEEGVRAENRNKNGRPLPQSPEAEAMAIMGLAPPVTIDEIKTRYKVLAKTHHPDLNGGCSKSEELLKQINMAYTILKLAFESYKDLPERAS